MLSLAFIKNPKAVRAATHYRTRAWQNVNARKKMLHRHCYSTSVCVAKFDGCNVHYSLPAEGFIPITARSEHRLVTVSLTENVQTDAIVTCRRCPEHAVIGMKPPQAGCFGRYRTIYSQEQKHCDTFSKNQCDLATITAL